MFQQKTNQNVCKTLFGPEGPEERGNKTVESNTTSASKVFGSSSLRAAAKFKRGGANSKKRRVPSQASFFRGQLNNLMASLEAMEPHFVRCIKANAKKKPDLFDSQLCLEQLTYSGVFETVQIRKSGLPFRFQHKMFYKSWIIRYFW